MANFCDKCGVQLEDNGIFCTNCGAKIIINEVQDYVHHPIQQAPPQPVRQTQQPVQQVYQPTNQEPPVKEKNGKRVIIAVIAVLLAVAIAIGGFLILKGPSDKSDDADEEAGVEIEGITNKNEDKVTIADEIIVSTGGQVGTYYAFTKAVCSQLPGKFTVVSSGGSQVNIENIANGEAQMAIVQSDIMNYAYTGENVYSTPVRGFSAIGCMYSEVCQLVARADSGIVSLDGLRGKTVAIGDVGSGVYYNAHQILEAAGIDVDRDINAVKVPFNEASAMLADGSVDAAFIVAGMPTTSVDQLATTTDITIVEMSDIIIGNLMAENSFYQKYTLTSDNYDFITVPFNTVCLYSTFIVSDNLSEEVVYEITKSIWENVDAISAAHAKGAEIDINTALKGLGDVPLHPGAERYYREVGALN